MFPGASPASQLGQLESEIHLLQNDIRRKADDYKVSSLNHRVDALVSAVRDVSTVCDSILSRLQMLEEKQLGE